MKSVTISFLIMLYASSVFAAGGIVVNGDLTLKKETEDPYRVLYFSNGSSEFSASPWSVNGFNVYTIGDVKVGINTPSPATELDVNGTVKALSFQGDGSGLTNVATTIADGTITDAKITGPISASKLDLSNVQKKYGKIAMVAQSGGDYSDPVAAIAGVPTWCGTPSATNPCLIKIMPGVYTVTSAVVMQPYIDIEGAGEQVTKITSVLSSLSSPPTVGTVQGSNNAELRFLTIENTGIYNYNAAILNISASPSLTHVTVKSTATGAISNYAIYNSSSSPTMINVTAITTGANVNNNSINNLSSSPLMSNLVVTASGASTNIGIFNNSSSTPIMDNITVSALNTTASAANNFAIYNSSSSPIMTNIKATAKGVGTCCGIYNYSSSPTMTNVVAIASEATSTNTGVSNASFSSPIMTNVIVIATGTSTSYNYGVRNDYSSPIMTNLTVTTSGALYNYGVQSSNYGIVKINHSVIKGSTYTITNNISNTTRVGNSQLDGGPVLNTATLTCAGVYDENYVFYASSCP